MKIGEQDYLNSFDDTEELGIYDLTELFYQANTLLVRAIEEEHIGQRQQELFT